MKITKAVIPAAGLGTRFLPATKAQPKEMLPIVDKPTIQYIVEEAVASGIEDIIIITGRTKKAIEDHFDRSLELEMELSRKNQHEQLSSVHRISDLANIHYIRQKQAAGLGHAVFCARTFVGSEPFACLLGDDIIQCAPGQKPALRQLMDVYERVGHTVLGVQEVSKERTGLYGIVDPLSGVIDGCMQVRDLVEKPNPLRAPSRYAIMGRYIITPEIFPVLEETLPGAGGEIQLTDALKLLLGEQPITACVFTGKRYDVGDKLGFLAATLEFALEREDMREEVRDYLRQLQKEGAF